MTISKHKQSEVTMTTLKGQIKQLKKAIKRGDANPFIYKDEELRFMKQKLRQIVELNARMVKEQKNGFGV